MNTKIKKLRKIKNFAILWFGLFSAALLPILGITGSSLAGRQRAEPALTQLESPVPAERVKDIRELEAVNPVVVAIDKYSYEQMSRDLKKLSTIYGEHMKINVIGKSLDKRDIYEVVVGNQDADRHILMQAGIHGREYITSLLVMKQIELALYSYQKGSYNGRAVSELLNETAIHFVPMSNPDGISISQSGLASISSEKLQKNILRCYETDKKTGKTSSELENYLIRWKANARGVDLNNNFAAGWEKTPMLSAPSCSSYKGKQPNSEPETQALTDLAGRYSWAATVSYHSMGRLVYWDYPINYERDTSRQFGNMVAGATGYTMSLSENSHGGFKDWMQSSLNSAPSITLEVGMGTCPLPLKDFPQIWTQNKSVWAIALEFAAQTAPITAQ